MHNDFLKGGTRMENFDYDLQSVQEARNLARLGKIATDKLADYTEEQID